MKVRAITRFMASARCAVEARIRGGFVEVVSIECRSCGRWIAPHEWHPKQATCDVCAACAMRGRCSLRGHGSAVA